MSVSVRTTAWPREPGTSRELCEIPDPEVVERVRAGESGLFEVIMRRHNRRLFRIAWSILLDEGEAEDVIQDTYVRAFEHLDRFEGRAELSTWLSRIAVHEAWARRKKSRRQVPLESLEPPVRERLVSETAGPGADAETRAISRDVRGFVMRALAALPPASRQVFVLREVEGLNTRETAEVLGLSRTATKVRLFRARRRLRLELEALTGETAADLLSFAGRRCDRVVAAVTARIGTGP